MNLGHACARLVQAGAVYAAVALVAGCGSQYRAVVTPITPSGPAAQPISYAVAISAPSPTTSGIATVIDYSGDTVMATATIGIGPTTFTLDETGSTGYTVNHDGTMSNFPISSSLHPDKVTVSTLPSTADPVSLFSPSAGVWVTDLDRNVVDVMTGTPVAFQKAIPVAPTPVAIVGPGLIGQHNYAISLNPSKPTGSIITYDDMTCNNAPSTVTQNGEATSLETASYSVSAHIALGKCPVYAVPSSDGKRLFVLNRGSDTVTVINSQENTLNTCTPFVDTQTGRTVTCHSSLPLSTTAVTATGITPVNGTSGMTATAGPVYAEYNVATGQLVVANYDGGTISVIDVSLDEYGNDSANFGATYTIPVGNNPASVTVLYDGSRAYTANQADGTVSIVNLSSHKVEKTLGVVGHPRTVVSTQNSSYGKVYVASPDSPYLTVIETGGTNPDIVDTTVLVSGNIVDVRVTSQNADSSSKNNSGNNNNVSRKPGAGQPCYLPPSLEPLPSGTETALQVCQTLP
jgi:YVTN family beta-propeller protein